MGALLLAISFSGCDKTSLKDITNPQLGIYECTQATVNGKDYLDYFNAVTLELKTEDEFILHYEGKRGVKGEEKGKYRYDREKETLTIFCDGENGFERRFPLVDGVCNIYLQLGGKNVSLRFERR